MTTKMTFKDWHERYNINYTETKFGVIQVADNEVGGNKRVELYELTDYIVGSLVSGTLWLVKRK